MTSKKKDGDANGVTLNAPENAGGITVNGTAYEVEGGQVTVAPEHVADALSHGYTAVPVKK